MGKCEICGKNEEGLSLLQANHRQLGYVNMCQACWESIYTKNLMVCGTTGGGTCPSCR